MFQRKLLKETRSPRASTVLARKRRSPREARSPLGRKVVKRGSR